MVGIISVAVQVHVFVKIVDVNLRLSFQIVQ